MHEEKRKTEEVYCIDAQKELNMLISGGGDDAVTFYAFNGEEYVIDEVIEGFEDSVIMAKFITESKAVAVSMDGTIAEIRITRESGRFSKEVRTFEMQADVTRAVLSGEGKMIFLGTSEGLIEAVSVPENGTIERAGILYAGHSSGILEIVETKSHIYTASCEQILIFDRDGRVSAKYRPEKGREIRVMQVNTSGKSVAVGYGDGGVEILSFSSSQGSLVSVYENKSAGRESVESMAFAEETLLCGDFTSTLSIIDTKYKRERRRRVMEEDSCIVRIIAVSAAVAVAVANTGKVSVVSLHADNKILAEYSLHTITLDALLFNRHICAATVQGVEFLPLSG
ncbi:uncharacterized protein NEMAJ01_1823 [Nematocida major]|uniref:uncharacterized protein n=1 Tax=Nematocida major TaxID=1912982 RepID=UPI00200781BC|nr:uncharacterized protein NEMAJ01_1823 [Nematocida major]KAH9386927.1 hypothetical protein NEMAJ01_1823 [Nematocida major]